VHSFINGRSTPNTEIEELALKNVFNGSILLLVPIVGAPK
jgi:hypothetical protein